MTTQENIFSNILAFFFSILVGTKNVSSRTWLLYWLLLTYMWLGQFVWKDGIQFQFVYTSWTIGRHGRCVRVKLNISVDSWIEAWGMRLAIINFYKMHNLLQQKEKVYSENTIAETYVQIKPLSKYYTWINLSTAFAEHQTAYFYTFNITSKLP